MKVVSYLATLPAKQLISGKGGDKANTLQFFADGVQASGDNSVFSAALAWQPADVAVMLGWVHEHGKTAPHLAFRQQILDNQKAHGGRTIIADSNLFLYRNSTNPGYFLRYSYDGVFPNTGEYCNSFPDPERWNVIKRHYGLELQPWREQGNYILLCLQRDGGWSMSGSNVVDWAMTTVKIIRQYSDLPILVRGHPGDKRNQQQVKIISERCRQKNIKKVHATQNQHLMDDLRYCWAVVNHNSSPAVAAAIEGIPVFVTDPDRSQARAVANTDFSKIGNPELFDRQRWIESIAQFHWSHAEVRSGQCWQHMKQWAKK